MRLSLLSLFLTVATHAQTWLAYNMEGRNAVTPYVAPGDLVTVDLPVAGKRQSKKLAFLVRVAPTDLSEQVITSTIDLDATSGSPWFPTYTYNGVSIPTSVRLWFSSAPKPYDFKDVTAANEFQYWWSNPTDIDLEDLILFGPTILAENVGNPSRWSSAWGKNGSAFPAQFHAAAANARQVGFSFGGYFFDTGATVTGGTATLHVKDLVP